MVERKPLYHVADVAKLLGVTTHTVYRYMQQGKLQGRKLGKYWLFTEQEVEAMLQSGEKPAEELK